MNNTAYFISTLLIYALVPLIIGIVSARSANDTSELNIMKYSKFFLIVGILGNITVIIAFILCTLQGYENIRVAIFCISVCSIMFLIGLWLSFLTLNWRLIFDENVLIYKNILGITRRYNYSDITRIRACYNRDRSKLEKYKIYIGKRKITVECLVKNFGSFERLMKNRLKKAKNLIKIEGKPRK